MFILDSKQQVTETISKKWMDFLRKFYPGSEEDLMSLSKFLAGGIGEMIFSRLSIQETDEKKLSMMVDNIVKYMVLLLDVSEEEKKDLLYRVTGKQ
jgi:hypothetical protein